VRKQSLPKEFLALLKAVKGKRSRIVVEHILEHGFITTEDLEIKYGYIHPPRAVRDVREQGIPLESFTVKNAEGRSIAAYRFGDPSQVRHGKLGGRRVISKAFKRSLVQEVGARCSICLQDYEVRYLQIDHRIPYEVIGDATAGTAIGDYMLVCGSCNRAKSWSCEHCANWLELKNPEFCKTCYWASPESYQHIALRPIRRLDLVWTEEEIEFYERLRRLAQAKRSTMPEYVKAALREHIEDDEN
jgi:hypothetical protein